MSGEDQSYVKNAGDESQVRAAGSRENKRRVRELTDLKAVLGTLQGRRLFWRLLEYSAVLRDPDVLGDVQQTYKNIGVQSVGRYILAEIEAADGNAWDQMRKEKETYDHV